MRHSSDTHQTETARGEHGGVLILALLFLALGSMLIPPALSYIRTGLDSIDIYERKTDSMHAAGSGIDDAFWHAKKGDLETLLTNPSAYAHYDFDTTWSYALSGDRAVNGCDIQISLRNIWIPSNISAPTPAEASAIINLNKLILTGEQTGDTLYSIGLSFNPAIGAPGDLIVDTVGAWLPAGFTYANDSILEYAPYYLEPAVTPHAGGQALIWTFNPAIDFDEVPSEVTFSFNSRNEDRNPSIVSWITTDGVSDVPYAWDADSRIYHITSAAGDATAQAYVAKSELREFNATISGDYAAIGNGLLGGNETYHDQLHEYTTGTFGTDDGDPGRSVNELPPDATIKKAYLYWAGWMDWHEYDATPGDGLSWDAILIEDDCTNFTDDVGDSTDAAWSQSGTDWSADGDFTGHHQCAGGASQTILLDNCSSFSDDPTDPLDIQWTYGGDWTLDSGRFRAHATYYSDSTSRSLTMSTGIDLSSYSPGEVTVSWEQYAPSLYVDDTDCLSYYFLDQWGYWDYMGNAFCGEDPNPAFTTTINDSQYLHAGFEIRFYIQYFGGSYEYCYLDNITIEMATCPPAPEGDRYLTMTTILNLNLFSEGEIMLAWEQSDQAGDQLEGAASPDVDRLWFSLWNSSGWSAPVEAFTDDNPDSPYTYVVPEAYLTGQFKMRFLIQGFDASAEYCHIDRIIIGTPGAACSTLKYPTADPSDENLRHLIEDCARVNQVMFTPGWLSSGTQVMVSYDSGLIRVEPSEGAAWTDTWSYACRADITDIVEQAIDEGSLSPNGAGAYTIGHVVEENRGKSGYSVDFYAGGDSTGYPLGYPAGQYDGYTTRYCYSYAGWSLVFIYTSPESTGHQLYLYDDMFEEAWGGDKPLGWEDPDFDGDGQPGGIISGFLIPEDIEEEPGKVTAFVVEGDRALSQDSFKVNGIPLSSDNTLESSNVWDGDWRAGTHDVSGVDIDTFTIDSGILSPGDTQVELNLRTYSDGFILTYLILSFSSDVTTGGAMTYLLEL